jgi:transketolase
MRCEMYTVEELQEFARVARVDAVKALWASQSGHPGSSLSAMDAMIAIYFGGYLRHRPEDPHWGDRDIFILSQGHAAPGYYSCLALNGYFDRTELASLRQLNSRLEGHVKRGSLPGVECSAGSLGQGLNFGTGVAMAIRRAASERRVFVMMSDGEQQEGSTWEGVMFAGSHQLGNITAIVDVNRNQINGPTHEIMPINDVLSNKYSAFGWNTVEIDGNDMAQLRAALDQATGHNGAPTAIISHTVTGKGVPYMEGDYHWHHGKITDDLFVQAMKALGEPVGSTPDDSWAPGTTSTQTAVG